MEFILRTLLVTHIIMALLLLGIVGVSHADWQPVGNTLPTRWDKAVSPSNPLPEYPRPQMTRTQWQSLNGLWDFGFTGSAATDAPTAYSGKILVPYPMESALSGVHHPTSPEQRLWYRRTFTVPAGWRGQRVLLHFGAVNWDSTVAVNGKALGEHKGGYDGFDYDITAALRPGANELIVSAWNPVNSDNPTAQIIGKQRVHPVQRSLHRLYGHLAERLAGAGAGSVHQRPQNCPGCGCQSPAPDRAKRGPGQRHTGGRDGHGRQNRCRQNRRRGRSGNTNSPFPIPIYGRLMTPTCTACG